MRLVGMTIELGLWETVKAMFDFSGDGQVKPRLKEITIKY